MIISRDTLFASRRLRASAWLTLLSLALFQLTLAGHQLDHEPTEQVDHCEICVKLERLDDVTTGQELPVETPGMASDSEPTDPVVAAISSRPNAFDSRGPPTVLI